MAKDGIKGVGRQQNFIKNILLAKRKFMEMINYIMVERKVCCWHFGMFIVFVLVLFLREEGDMNHELGGILLLIFEKTFKVFFGALAI